MWLGTAVFDSKEDFEWCMSTLIKIKTVQGLRDFYFVEMKEKRGIDPL
jgi:hypothetical protein